MIAALRLAAPTASSTRQNPQPSRRDDVDRVRFDSGLANSIDRSTRQVGRRTSRVPGSLPVDGSSKLIRRLRPSLAHAGPGNNQQTGNWSGPFAASWRSRPFATCQLEQECRYMAENDTVWPLEEHTRAKHELLRRYLGAWFPILASSGWNRRLVFLDGFAGPGVYAGGEPGSPMIALTTLLDHPHFAKWTSVEFVFIFVEADPERFASLKAELKAFWANRPGGQPDNVKIHTDGGTFQEVAEQIVAQVADSDGKSLAPTLAFVDPFGWSGVPMTVIRDLLSPDKCEVLFNFMYDSVNRFVTDSRPNVARHFAELFGTGEAEHLAAAGLSGAERKEFLRDLYEQQLGLVGGFTHVRSFELKDLERGRTAYYLMFGTRHHIGLKVMKDAMWALDPVAGRRFEGFAGDQAVLFTAEPNFVPLRDAILSEFVGRTVSVDAIERFVIEETDYKTSHFKREVLKPLEQEGVLVCESPRKKRWTYPSGTMLRFGTLGR